MESDILTHNSSRAGNIPTQRQNSARLSSPNQQAQINPISTPRMINAPHSPKFPPPPPPKRAPKEGSTHAVRYACAKSELMRTRPVHQYFQTNPGYPA